MHQYSYLSEMVKGWALLRMGHIDQCGKHFYSGQRTMGFTVWVCRWRYTSHSVLYPSTPEAQHGEHDEWEDNATVRHGLWAWEEGMGGSLHLLHGGQGHGGPKPAFSGQEAAGSVPPLPLCSRDRRLGNGEQFFWFLWECWGFKGAELWNAC